jgi:hypothetical protein
MRETAIDLLKEFVRRTDPEWDINQRAQAFIDEQERRELERKASYDGHEAFEEDMK